MDIAISSFKVCKKCYKCAEDKKDKEDEENESEDGSNSEDNTETEKKTKTKSSAPKSRKKRSAEYRSVKQNESETKTTQPQAQHHATVENHFNPVFHIINSPYAPLAQIPELPGFKAEPSTSAAPARPGDDIVEWVPSSIEKAGELYRKAVIGGKDIDNSDLWIIRARVYGEMIPGKLNIEHSLAFVAYKRDDTYVEKNVENFQVLCVAPEHRHRIIWIQCCDGSVPKNAIVASTKDSKQPLYVGRKLHIDKERKLQSLCPGMVHPDRGLYITFGLKGYQYNSFEVMCLE